MDNITTSAADPAPGTRERLIAAMLHALTRKGFHGVGVAELLAHAGAPKGVLYHHFPGGKAALAVAAIEAVISQLTGNLDKQMQRSPDPAAALGAWLASAQRLLASSGFEMGCPLATIALESSADDVAIRQALASGFAAIRERLASALRKAGLPPEGARNLAALMVSAYEGALLQARVAGNVDTMSHTVDALLELVRAQLASAQTTNAPVQTGTNQETS